MPETDAKSARQGTIALFVASAAMATIGVFLLFGTGSSEHSDTNAAAPTATVPASGSASRKSPTPRVPSSTPAAAASEPAAPRAPRTVPGPMQDAARAFVIAWASHDARPGGDTSYDDASRRAADHAAGELAKDLRSRSGGSAGTRQWLSWKANQVRVTAAVVRVSLPDGAPSLTRDSGFARVLYKVVQKPGAGPPTAAQQHVALKLRRGGDGAWRVVGLPDV
ncbi:hypothetical protein [Streptomyces sp. NPDC047525]|uniref:hypothetical protein n=1 Tax=Streptomyces sp. NPDC047525 TaxID=3155264 RepID=UPI0033C2AFB4